MEVSKNSHGEGMQLVQGLIQPRKEEKEGRDRGGGESSWTDHQVCASLASRGGGG